MTPTTNPERETKRLHVCLRRRVQDIARELLSVFLFYLPVKRRSMARRRVSDSFVPNVPCRTTYVLVGDGTGLLVFSNFFSYVQLAVAALHILFFFIALHFFDFNSKSYFEREPFVGRRDLFLPSAFFFFLERTIR
jgi:hypothetical protein